jgi:hypothetical protein
MYPLETDIAGYSVPVAGVHGYTYNEPDTVVGSADMQAIANAWYTAPKWNQLSCDMPPYDHFIDVYDAAKVGIDWGKSATPATPGGYGGPSEPY